MNAALSFIIIMFVMKLLVLFSFGNIDYIYVYVKPVLDTKVTFHFNKKNTFKKTQRNGSGLQ